MSLPEPTYTTWLELRDYCIARATISQERNDPQAWAYWLDMAALGDHWADSARPYPPGKAFGDYLSLAIARSYSFPNVGTYRLSDRNIEDARGAARYYAFAKLCRVLAINQGLHLSSPSLKWMKDAHQRLMESLDENEAVRENATPPDRS